MKDMNQDDMKNLEIKENANMKIQYYRDVYEEDYVEEQVGDKKVDLIGGVRLGESDGVRNSVEQEILGECRIVKQSKLLLK
ncbi:MAG: hypothetical protein EZS28_001793 [Streblomastix strix]|uniref:Uncharacterized protein n=1 Tax=Streblomastix strix TaxID=222440 RepID=A0A5J4X7G4_9EUKA|nr:MAG: hypothetical protein EZS28_001793 [Streblomastix strix]